MEPSHEKTMISSINSLLEIVLWEIETNPDGDEEVAGYLQRAQRIIDKAHIKMMRESYH